MIDFYCLFVCVCEGDGIYLSARERVQAVRRGRELPAAAAAAAARLCT